MAAKALPRQVVPPPAGAWIRTRQLSSTLARTKRGRPEWSGLWHLATGDLRGGGDAVSPVAIARCGHRVLLRLAAYDGTEHVEYAIAEDPPTAHVCRRCLRAFATGS